MRLLTMTAFILVGVASALAQANTIRIDYVDGNTEFITDEGVVQAEYFTRDQDPEAYCLAENIYFEARAESFSGKAAVGNVTRNRVNDKRWPNTYCGVVTQGPVRESWKTKCRARFRTGFQTRCPARQARHVLIQAISARPE